MADRRQITDRTLKALRPAPMGSRLETWDTREPGFGVRVSDRKDADPQRRGKAGKITFVLYGRFTPGAPPTRRAICDYPGVSLEQARDTAGRWKSLISKGIDPAIIEAEAARVEALRNQGAKALQLVYQIHSCLTKLSTSRVTYPRVTSSSVSLCFVASRPAQPCSPTTWRGNFPVR